MYELYCPLIIIVPQILKHKISKDLPLDDGDAAGDFTELQKSLLTAWKMQLKDLQRAHHLIGNFCTNTAFKNRSSLYCICFRLEQLYCLSQVAMIWWSVRKGRACVCLFTQPLRVCIWRHTTWSWT